MRESLVFLYVKAAGCPKYCFRTTVDKRAIEKKNCNIHRPTALPYVLQFCENGQTCKNRETHRQTEWF